jgi:hypothetical protein
MRLLTLPNYSCHIYLSGPIDVAKQILREECLREGLCVTVEPTTYIYTGGEEQGYVVGLVNYPRFPKSPGEIKERAMRIATDLLLKTHQLSALVVDPMESSWVSRRTEE